VSQVTDMHGWRVEVRNRFDGGWSGGYVLEEVIRSGSEELYRIRRDSDGVVLPTLFGGREVRRADTDFVVEWEIASGT
jgi:hypothetical protein